MKKKNTNFNWYITHEPVYYESELKLVVGIKKAVSQINRLKLCSNPTKTLTIPNSVAKSGWIQNVNISNNSIIYSNCRFDQNTCLTT